MPPILYLIDGHALAYRAYFALTAGGNDSLRTRAGEPTAGIFGFASILIKLLEKEKPEYLAVAFDTGKTFRNDLYADYKATRAKMPDDLRPQIERIRQMVDALGMPRLEKEGVEADDVLGSIARQAVAQGFGVKIITGDKDLLQLVDDRIMVELPGKGISEARNFSAKEVVELLGIPPEQVVDYKALVGDHSDNIKGVPGIGEKTAVSLLTQYKTLDDIYSHLDEIPPRIRAKLEDGRESAFLSHELARIRTDVTITLDLEKASTAHLNYEAVSRLFSELEFKTLIVRLKSLSNNFTPLDTQQLTLFTSDPGTSVSSGTYKIAVNVVDTPELLQNLSMKLRAAPAIALDTETTSTDPMQANLVGISLSVAEGEGWYIPIGHHTGELQLPWKDVLEVLIPIFTNPKHAIWGHNLKYDALVLWQHGLHLNNLTFDTMLAGWLIDPASRSLGLKDMAWDLLKIEMTHIEVLIGKGKNQKSMAEVPIAIAAEYAAADAEVTFRLQPLLLEKMEKQQVLPLFQKIEIPLIPVLATMEQNGIQLDLLFLQKMSAELKIRLAELEQNVYHQAGYPFNINSTQQLSKVLFDTLKLEPPDRRKKTMSGHFSTNAEVLEELRGKHPVVDDLLEYRELSKLRSTYLEALPTQINPITGRVHTSYNQTGSVTGRLASSDPNLQNIPTRTEIGKQVRCAFVASQGKLLLSVDYSQIELRIVAHMSGDEAMLNAFRNNEDIHAATAAAIYNIPLKDVSKDQRRHAKAINFGLIYGMGAFGLTRTTDLTLAEAENFVKEYFRDFPKVKSYLEGIRHLAAKQGYVETLLGRRRYFPNLKNPINQMLKAREEREAINAPIQGTAADIMKMAMVNLPGALQEAALSAKLLLQVHDELVLECPKNELLKTAAITKHVMENAFTLQIPLSTEARWGENWGNLKPLDEFSIN